jgi:hypothetical protein
MTILKAALPELRALYAVKDLAVFGSVARGEAANHVHEVLRLGHPGRAFDGVGGTEQPVNRLGQVQGRGLPSFPEAWSVCGGTA